MARLLTLALALFALAPALAAQDRSELRRVVLVNGDVYVGTVADESADPVVVRTTDGIERTFARDQVELIAPLIRGRFFRTDPVRTRFFVAPTARTLGGGEFRGDLTYFLPSVTAGLSDRVDLLASGLFTFGSVDGDGAFFTPLVGLKGQVYRTETAAVAVGLSGQAQFGSGSNLSAIPYAVATFGDETRAVSVGLGGFVGSYDGEVDVTSGLVYGVGAETQVNNGVKLFVEALGTFGIGETEEVCFEDDFGRRCFEEGSELDNGLLVLPGVRFFGDRFAFDVIGFVATDFDSLIGFAPVGARASYAF